MHVLALAVGDPNVERVEASMTERQLANWMRFYADNPWGPRIDWTRHGMQMAMIANTAPNRRKGSKPAKPEDFMPAKRSKALEERRTRRLAMREIFGDKVKVPGEKRNAN